MRERWEPICEHIVRIGSSGPRERPVESERIERRVVERREVEEREP